MHLCAKSLPSWSEYRLQRTGSELRRWRRPSLYGVASAQLGQLQLQLQCSLDRSLVQFKRCNRRSIVVCESRRTPVEGSQEPVVPTLE